MRCCLLGPARVLLPPAIALAALLGLGALPAAAQAVGYDVVYVRQPRYGDLDNTVWPEVFHPARAEPGADLMLLHPDGSEEVLVACSAAAGGNGVCSVTDPFVSFDGEWVYYSLFHDLTSLNGQRDDLPLQGADVFRIHVPTRQVEQLTHGEFTPNTGAGHWDETNPLDPASEFNRLGYGILNLGPCPLPGGKHRLHQQPQRVLAGGGVHGPDPAALRDGRGRRATSPRSLRWAWRALCTRPSSGTGGSCSRPTNPRPSATGGCGGSGRSTRTAGSGRR